MKDILKEIEEDLEIEGYEPDTPVYGFLLLERRIEYCQSGHKVPACPACGYYDYCELIKKYLKVLKGLGRP